MGVVSPDPCSSTASQTSLAVPASLTPPTAASAARAEAELVGVPPRYEEGKSRQTAQAEGSKTCVLTASMRYAKAGEAGAAEVTPSQTKQKTGVLTKGVER